MTPHLPAPLRILVADDEEPVLEIYRKVLAPSRPAAGSEMDLLAQALFGQTEVLRAVDFEPLFCRQAEQAVAAVQDAVAANHPFAVAFLDVRMPPGPDGIWAARKIRDLDPDVEIVIVTAFSDYQPDDIAARVPPAHKLLYLQKPVYPQELAQFARALSAKWQTEIQLRQVGQDLEQRVARRTGQLAAAKAAVEQELNQRRQLTAQLEESQARYRDLFENAHDMIQSVDPEGRFVFVNPSWKATLGYAEKDLNNLRLFDIIAPESMAHCRPLFAEIMQGRSVDGIEAVFLTKNGRAISVEGNVVPRLMDGKAVATHGFFRDVTVRKQTAMQLQRNYHIQQAVKGLLELSLDPMPLETLLTRTLDLIATIPQFVFEGRGVIFLVKDQSLVLTAQKGLPEPISARCTRVSFGQCICGQAAQTQQLVFSDSTDVRHSIHDPNMPPHSHYAVPIVDNGATLGVISLYLEQGHLRDPAEEAFLQAIANTLAGIIMRRRAEQDKANAEAQLRQAQKMEALGVLAGGIAHDFNNILAGIVGYAELSLLDCRDNRNPAGHLDQILKASQRATELVRQILAFSRRSDQGRQPIQLSVVVKEALRLLKGSIPPSIQIHARIDAVQGVVLADPGQIHQVMMNLATNAYHAMEPAGGDLTVRLYEDDRPERLATGDRSEPGTYLCLEISDTGCGIDPAIRERIFEPYFTTKEKGRGTGLGLATVHGIVQAHAGQIEVASQPGQGTTFRLFFPRLSSQAVTEACPQDCAVAGQGGETILVVDDEADLTEMIEQMLRPAGYSVWKQSSATAALEMFGQQPQRFDAAILDMVMPRLSGLDLAVALRQTRPHLPIVFCTGHVEHRFVDQANAMAGTTVLTKPVRIAELTGALRRLLDQRRDG